MAELNFDLFEHYHSRAVEGDGEAARDLLRLFADRVSNPEQEPLQQRERDVLAMALRRFADYSDDVEKERDDKQRRKWTPMRVFMPEGGKRMPNAATGPMKMARKAADSERQLQYVDTIVAFHHAAKLPLPDLIKEGAAKKIAADFTKAEKKRGGKGASYKTLQTAYAAFRPHLDAYMRDRYEVQDEQRALNVRVWWDGLTEEQQAEVLNNWQQQSGTKNAEDNPA